MEFYQKTACDDKARFTCLNCIVLPFSSNVVLLRVFKAFFQVEWGPSSLPGCQVRSDFWCRYSQFGRPLLFQSQAR